MRLKFQKGIGLMSALLVIFVVGVAATTLYGTWGPIYEETCVEPSAQQLEGAKKINELVSSPFGGEYKPQAKCSKVPVR